MLRPARPGLRHNSAFPVQLPPSVYTGLRRWSALPPALLPGALIVLAVRMLFHPGWNGLGHIHSLSMRVCTAAKAAWAVFSKIKARRSRG